MTESESMDRDSTGNPLLNDAEDIEGDLPSPRFEESSHRHRRSNSSLVFESLPLLRRPSISLGRTKTNVSLGSGSGSSYDGESVDDHREPLVRVQSGVKKVEAITLLWTKRSLFIAYVRSASNWSIRVNIFSIFLIANVTSLDNNTTQVLVPYATSSFNTHSLLSLVGIVSGIMLAVVKTPMAKIGDVFGRMEAFLLSILLYIAGYIQMAFSNNVQVYAVSLGFHLSSCLECRHILCGWDNGLANHATNRHC